MGLNEGSRFEVPLGPGVPLGLISIAFGYHLAARNSKCLTAPKSRSGKGDPPFTLGNAELAACRPLGSADLALYPPE